MKEIKFRAWDKEKKKMISEEYWLLLGGDGSVYEYKLGKLYTASNYKLMQYTGLKDKNGKEIYEGDILKIFDKNYEVKFNISESGMKVDYGYPVIHNGPAPHWVEVIGNIYENKDLLK